MKFSSIITAVFVCLAIFVIVLKRDALINYAYGGKEGIAQEAAENLADAKNLEDEAKSALAAAQTVLEAASASVQDAKNALPKDVVKEVEEVTRSTAVSVLAIKSIAQDVTSGILLRGETSAFKFIEVKAETSGQVISQPLRKGTLIEEGELVCELDLGTRGSALAEAKALLAEAQNNETTAKGLVKKGFASEQQLISREAALETAQATVERAEQDIQKLRITAPFSGLLETDTAEFGDVLQTGGTCATVIALDPIKLIGFATEQQVARIAVGANAGAQLITGEQVEGKVTFISRSADQVTRTFLVEIAVPNPLLKIRDGSTADIYIGLDGDKGHLLPQSALTLDGDGRLGIRASVDNKAAFFPVTIIRDTAEGMWVTGLPNEIDIIVLGHEYVTSGTSVRVTFKDDKS